MNEATKDKEIRKLLKQEDQATLHLAFPNGIAREAADFLRAEGIEPLELIVD